MSKLTALIICSLFMLINTQRPQNGRPSPSVGLDMSKCMRGIETINPFLFTLVEEVYMEDPESYLQDLKILYNHFRAVAADCGISLPTVTNVGNPSKCKQDMKILNSLFNDLRNQAQKSVAEQSVISIITIYMSLANNVPKALQDCGFRRN